MKMMGWLKRKLPWAPRQHKHADTSLFRYFTCSRCGHLVMSGHVGNVVVEARLQGAIIHSQYGASCAPVFSLLEMAADTTVRVYTSENKELRPEEMSPQDRQELERMKERMIDLGSRRRG